MCLVWRGSVRGEAVAVGRLQALRCLDDDVKSVLIQWKWRGTPHAMGLGPVPRQSFLGSVE